MLKRRRKGRDTFRNVVLIYVIPKLFLGPVDVLHKYSIMYNFTIFFMEITPTALVSYLS